MEKQACWDTPATSPRPSLLLDRQDPGTELSENRKVKAHNTLKETPRLLGAVLALLAAATPSIYYLCNTAPAATSLTVPCPGDSSGTWHSGRGPSSPPWPRGV